MLHKGCLFGFVKNNVCGHMHRSLILDNAHLSSHTAWPYSKRSGRTTSGSNLRAWSFLASVLYRAAVYILPGRPRCACAHCIILTTPTSWPGVTNYTSEPACTSHRLPVATWPSNPYSTHTRLWEHKTGRIWSLVNWFGHMLCSMLYRL